MWLNKCPDHGQQNVQRVPSYRNKGPGRVIGRGEGEEGEAGGREGFSRTADAAAPRLQ